MATEGGLQGVVIEDPAGGQPANRATQRDLTEVEDALRAIPSAFDFFQAVRLLEQLRPERAAPGHFAHPASEVVRFSVNPSIAFPPAEIHSLDLPAQGPAQMRVNFFGLTGPQGVLPYDYTLLVAERLRARDSALGAFLDLFHHRMLSLFYRAWERNRFTISYEKGRDDRFSDHLLDLVGQGLDAERRQVVSREILPFYVGLLGPHARSAVALEQLVQDLFAVPAQVEQFVGGWYPLNELDQCALGEEIDASSQLGLGAVAGDEIWDQQTRVRLRLGPLQRDRYNDFLPNGSEHALLRWVVRFFSRDAFDFELQLVLDRKHVPGCVLADDEAMPQPLGWSTWICTEPRAQDADDTVVRL
ncbi:MAG: type VI secretion system baseplate subunit TssG [Longimicrobiales bacterium]